MNRTCNALGISALALTAAVLGVSPAAATDYSVDQEEWAVMCAGDDAPAALQLLRNQWAAAYGLAEDTRVECMDMTLQLRNKGDNGMFDVDYDVSFRSAYLRLEDRDDNIPCEVGLTDGSSLTITGMKIEVDDFVLIPVNRNARVLRFHVPDGCRYVFQATFDDGDDDTQTMKAKTLYKDELGPYPGDADRKCGRFDFSFHHEEATPTQRTCRE